MAVHSIGFFAFVAVVLLLHYSLLRKRQNLLLLLASYVFYAAISLKFAVVLAVMTAANFGCALKIDKSRPRGHAWLRAGIVFNVSALLFFKAGNYFLPDVLALFSRLGLPAATPGMRIVLPVGFSFCVLQALSYLVDVQRKQAPVGTRLVDFALYLAYFPKLTAGPIERAKRFLSQVTAPRLARQIDFSRSLGLIVSGLLRKIVIADQLLPAIPATVFQTPQNFSPGELAVWLAAYAIGVYNDFCGYTDLVRGVSGFFGIELSRNFNLPFFSRNFTELWNRWHMTLCHWLRDYVYFPISRALVRRDTRCSHALNLLLPPMAATLASGLWHGCSAKFVTWGALMGLLLIGERLASLGRPLLPVAALPTWKRSLSVLKLWLLAGLVALFSAAEPGPAWAFLTHLFSFTPWRWPDSRVFLMILPSVWLDFRQLRSGDELFFLRWPLFWRAAFLALAGGAIFLFSRSGIPAPFVYQGF